MLRTITKMIAYAKAPVRTFAVFHPIRAAKMGLAYLVVKKALE